MIEDYQTQIEQLQQNLSQKDEERTVLRERLDEVELELKTTLDEYASKSTNYEENLQSLIEQQRIHSEEQ